VPGAGWNPYEGKSSGPFVRFVAATLKVIEVNLGESLLLSDSSAPQGIGASAPLDPASYREDMSFAAAILATQYGQGAESLARQIGVSTAVACELLAAHRRVYPDFWAWVDRVIDYAIGRRRLHTPFNWPLHMTDDANIRTLMNWPIQATAGDMLRLACCLATERRLPIGAPVHDAILLVSPADRVAYDADTLQRCMVEASRCVLAGFELRSDVKFVTYPNALGDARGTAMWEIVQGVLDVPRLAA
jgi:hypothetical protein